MRGLLNFLSCALLHGWRWRWARNATASCPICEQPRVVDDRPTILDLGGKRVTIFYPTGAQYGTGDEQAIREAAAAIFRQ